jgi:tetratricopeptide (TPR) repeat protein
MSRIANISISFLLGLALLVGAASLASASRAQGAQQQQQQQAAPTQQYGAEAYAAYGTCNSTTVPEQKIGCLDNWMAKYAKTDPGLLFYVSVAYLQTYPLVKDYPKSVEAADKVLSFPNLSSDDQFHVLYSRAQFYMAGINLKEFNTPEAINSARDGARQALKMADTLKKPDATKQEDWDKGKKEIAVFLSSVIATTSDKLKDYPGVIEAYKSLLSIDPTDGTSYYQIGNAYMKMTPPQYLDGFWNIARSISLKVQNEAQVRTYLRNLVAKYQGGLVQCDNLTDEEVNQMIALAGGSPDRPASYTLPTGDDLSKAQQDTANFIPYLQEGGDHGKLMWLAVCGLEYTDFVTKIIAIDLPPADAPPDAPIVLHVFTGADAAATNAGTVANMEVKIIGQPDAKRLLAGDEMEFTATLAAYDPSPFMLHWEKGKANPEFIPAEKGKPPVKKKPGTQQ